MQNIKLIISDFDGCLLDLKELHFDTLNKALETLDKKYIISLEDHIKIFDGLSTKKKLNILNQTKNFPLDKVNEINSLKQKFTLEALKTFNKINLKIKPSIQQLKEDGFLFYVASNAMRATVEEGLRKLDILHLVDKIYANEDVKNQKPSPEIYLKCMLDAGVEAEQTLIIEDSKHGREAALRSKAHLCEVDSANDFSYAHIIKSINQIKPANYKWYAKNTLNILIPMAGAGSRMRAKYHLPKPLIDVNGKPMIQRVVENLNMEANFIFIVQEEHYNNYNLGAYLNLIAPGCKIVKTDGLTEGAACTTLLAKDLINDDKHLLIANSDQIVDWDSSHFMYSMLTSDTDGGILTFTSENDPKWSYAKLDENGFVLEVAEKKPISNHATVGIYYYNKGSEYVKYAEQMISKNIRVNNEFYVAPIYNEMIQDKKKIKTYNCNAMHGIGTPEDLEIYLKSK